jgi:hypothetical protein
MSGNMFKWSCFGLAVIVCGVLLWLLDDMRVELRKTNATVNAHLPQIVANVNTATTTLANLSKDIESMRDLAGLTSSPSDPSLATYADRVLDFLEVQPNAQIGLKKLVGDGLKDVISAKDWARDTRKEALWLTFRASTKGELLERIGQNKFGSDWYFTAPGIPPIECVRSQAMLSVQISLRSNGRASLAAAWRWT